jgi:hypothetical protein
MAITGKAKCFVCERWITVRTTRFGDRILTRHMLAAYRDNSLKETIKEPINQAAYPDNEITCPGSGEPVEITLDNL